MPKTVPELPGIAAGTLPFSKVVEAGDDLAWWAERAVEAAARRL